MGNTTNSNESKEKFLIIPMIVIAMCQIGTTLDVSILSNGLRALMEGLNTDYAHMQIANMIYPMMATCLMLFGGIAGIKFGWNNTLKFGAIFCCVGEFTAAFAPTISIYIWIGRVLTGIGGSLLIPAAFGCTIAMYHGKNRVQAFGFLSAAMGFAMILPLLAAYVMDSVGWRYVYIGMGVYFIIVLIGSLKLPSIAKDKSMKLDYTGTVLYIIAISILSLSISNLPIWGIIKATLKAPFTIAGLSPAFVGVIVGIILFIILFKVEKRIEEKTGSALIPQSFIKNRQVLAGLILAIIPNATSAAFSMTTVPFLQLVMGYNVLKIGLLTLVLGIVLMVVSPLIPKLFAGKSMKKIILGSSFVGIISLMGLVCTIHQYSYSLVMVIIGLIGIGIMNSAHNTYGGPIVTNSLNAKDAQQSGGLMPTARNLGSTIGVAFIGMLMLTSINFAFSSQITKADITPETRAIVEENSQINYMGDNGFKDQYQNVEDEDDMAKLVEANANARKKALDYSIFGLVIFIALGEFYVIKHIPDKIE